MSQPFPAIEWTETGEILSLQSLPGPWRHLRLRAPRCAERARPGNLAYLSCHPDLRVCYALPVMRSAPGSGTVEFLYRETGVGTGLLSGYKGGARVSLAGPVGSAFVLHPERPRVLLIGADGALAPALFLAEKLHAAKAPWQPLALLAPAAPSPFTARPSQFLAPGMPPEAIGAMPLLEDWGIPSRLAGPEGGPGWYDGPVVELARGWLEALTGNQRDEVEIMAAGAPPTLEAVAALARDYGLPCQVWVEEFGPHGDGPVFEAARLFPVR